MTSPSCWRHVTTLVTKVDVPSAGPGESTEPSAHPGIYWKISKKVMPKHHQCHVVCWSMTRRKRGRRRIPSSWRKVVMHFRTKRSASSRPYMAIASGARGYADQAKSEAHWHGTARCGQGQGQVAQSDSSQTSLEMPEPVFGSMALKVWPKSDVDSCRFLPKRPFFSKLMFHLLFALGWSFQCGGGWKRLQASCKSKVV